MSFGKIEGLGFEDFDFGLFGFFSSGRNFVDVLRMFFLNGFFFLLIVFLGKGLYF